MPTADFDAASFLKSCTSRPGVYQMYAADGAHLYIGKAKNLKKRLSSYFRRQLPDAKTAALVERIHHIDVTVTGSETEALLLEQNLIKQERPPYNILLRDDKSYPYVFLSDHDDYPRLAFHRGARRRGGRYFGPFPSSHAVRESLNLLQKIFKVRQCEDSFFRNRTRPCLQYQIGRCSAPCVGYISEADYAESVRDAERFLSGKSTRVQETLAAQMAEASEAMEFERAAALRDRIRALTQVQTVQGINPQTVAEADVIALHMEGGQACVQVFFIRANQNWGNKDYYPRVSGDEDASEVMQAFVGQFYGDRDEAKAQKIAHLGAAILSSSHLRSPYRWW
mgnify:CR=1 FL=1